MAGIVADVLGYSAAAVGCVQLIPQVVRSVRTRNVAGVSPAMWALLGGQSGAWIVFGADRGLWPSVLVNVVLVACVTGMLRTMRSVRAPGTTAALGLLAGLLALGALLLTVASMAVLGAFASLLSALVFYPQVVMALRATDLSGLSRPSWLIGVGCSLQWAAFGFASGEPAVWASAVHNLVLAALVVVRLYAFAPTRAAEVLETAAA